jgi:hypothetical protein
MLVVDVGVHLRCVLAHQRKPEFYEDALAAYSSLMIVVDVGVHWAVLMLYQQRNAEFGEDALAAYSSLMIVVEPKQCRSAFDGWLRDLLRRHTCTSCLLWRA